MPQRRQARAEGVRRMTGCRHIWSIATPAKEQRGTAPAVCRLCGDVRKYKTAMPFKAPYRLPYKSAVYHNNDGR